MHSNTSRLHKRAFHLELSPEWNTWPSEESMLQGYDNVEFYLSTHYGGEVVVGGDEAMLLGSKEHVTRSL